MDSAAVPSRFISRKALALYLDTPVSTLAYWASLKKGPKPYRIGKKVLYDVSEIDGAVKQTTVCEVPKKIGRPAFKPIRERGARHA